MTRVISEADLRSMHRHSSNHRDEVFASALCGCFHCLETFAPSTIEDWCDDGQTALCPRCGIDSILGDRSSDAATDKAFLKQMHEFWFERTVRISPA